MILRLIFSAFLILSASTSYAGLKVNPVTGKLDLVGDSSGGSGNVGIGTTGWPAYYAANGDTISAFGGVRFVGSNVGIGSASPGQVLDVAGTVRITGTGGLNLGNDNLATIYPSATTTPDIIVKNKTPSATGGTITTSGTNKIHTFTTSGTFTPTFTGTINLLVVAAGGGSLQVNATNNPGPGGGGGVIANSSYAVTAGVPLTVTVGAGVSGAQGGNSVFNDQTAIGGGVGGSEGSGATAGTGGSGGGGGSNDGIGGAGTVGQGSDGGTTTFDVTTHRASGGGGATGVGTNASGSQTGDGGPGYTSSISGASVCYAGGGGGGAGATSAGSATCGGGAGSLTATANNGTANTGGGAGSAGGPSGDKGPGTGGSGIVIASYSTNTSAETARFTSVGNVGIGTTFPGKALDVTGDTRMSGDLTVTGDDLFMATNTNRFVLMGDGTNYNPEAIDLGTDTTGNYAAGDAEAGAALTGDSATSFFSTGTIEDARLPASMADKTMTGAFVIPQGTNPTANDVGEIAHDTTADQIILDDHVVGTKNKRLYFPIKGVGGNVGIGTYSIGNVEGFTISNIQGQVNDGTSITIDFVECAQDGTSCSYMDGTGIVLDTNGTSDSSFSNATIDKEDLMKLEVIAVSGAVTGGSATVVYERTRE